MGKRHFICAIALGLISGCHKASSGPPASTEQPEITSTQAASASDPAQMGEAFVAAYGQAAPMQIASQSTDIGTGSDQQGDDGPAIFTLKPEALFRLAGNVWVLVSDAEIPNGAIHYQGGHLSVAYLAKDQTGFRMIGHLDDAGGGGEAGNTSKWKIEYGLTSEPFLVATDEAGGQGCLQSYVDLVRLGRSFPYLVAKGILISEADYPDGVDYDTGKPKWQFSGTMHFARDISDLDHPALFIDYHGRVNGIDKYVYINGRYSILNKSVTASAVC